MQLEVPVHAYVCTFFTAAQAMVRAVKLLDHIPPYNTHKIGVVYVGEGQVSCGHSVVWFHISHSHPQTSEAEILANTSGSSRFQEFLAGLGQLVRLADCLPDQVYLGGLDRGGGDGEYAYLYQDDTTQGQAVSVQPIY